MDCFAGSTWVALKAQGGGRLRSSAGRARVLAVALVLGAATTAAATPQPMTRAAIIDLAKSAMGYSYYWGHGSWRSDGTQVGSCSGSCPSCTHSGAYGADCSGLAAKVWQVPSPSPITTDLHPYATTNFRNDMTWWTEIDRGSLQPADALVYNASGAGHIFIYESGDGWGSMWTYECKGCSYGCVHDLRTASSSYIAIRRDLLQEQSDGGAPVDGGGDARAAGDSGAEGDAAAGDARAAGDSGGTTDAAAGHDGGISGDGGTASVDGAASADGAEPCAPGLCDLTPDAQPPEIHGGCAVGAGAGGTLAGLAGVVGLLLVLGRRRAGRPGLRRS
jgi:hypothetical protein